MSSITLSGQEDWRSQCEGLADLIVKFLHSMRRLQKVVHKKESNVQKEKQEFEICKKELEVYLKQVKNALESNVVSVPETQVHQRFEIDNVRPTQSVRVGSHAPTSDLAKIGDGSEKQIEQLKADNNALTRKHAKDKQRV